MFQLSDLVNCNKNPEVIKKLKSSERNYFYDVLLH